MSYSVKHTVQSVTSKACARESISDRYQILVSSDEQVELQKTSSTESSFFGASMNVVNAAMGSGVLVFPNEFANLGLSLGVGSLVIAAFLMISTLHIVGKAGYICKSPNYQDAVKALVGTFASKGICITMGFYILGTCTSYLILIADQVEAVFKYSWLTRTVIIILAGVLAFPIMLMPDITLLSYTSTFGVVAQCYMVGCVMYHCLRGIVEEGIEPSPIQQANWGTSLGTAFALYTFSLQCHMVFIPVVQKLRNQTPMRIDGVAVTGVFSCALLYAIVGILGYLNYGEDVNEDVLAFNLPDTVDVQVARIAIALKNLVSYPLLHFAARMCIANFLGYDLSHLQWKDSNYPRKIYVLITSMFLAISVFIATTVSHLDTLIDLNGAVLGVFQVYFWPALLYYYLSESPRTLATKLVALTLIILCFAVTGFAVFNALERHSK